MARLSGFSLEEIDAALEAAGVSTDTREWVQQALSAIRKPSGRPPEDDDELASEDVAEIILDLDETNPDALLCRAVDQERQGKYPRWALSNACCASIRSDGSGDGAGAAAPLSLIAIAQENARR